MIVVKSISDENNIYKSNANISGNTEALLIELNCLFETIITSKRPELLHAIVSYKLPEIAEQIAENKISESILSHFMDVLDRCDSIES